MSDALTRNKLEILAKLGDASAPINRPRIRLAYRLTPQRVHGRGSRRRGIGSPSTGTDEMRTVEAGMVLTSIGYRGKPIRDLPFDDEAAVVPNDGGRVIDGLRRTGAGAYVAGWIKRGPTGFIGTNKSCAAETVHKLVADYNEGRSTDPVAGPAALEKLVRDRRPAVVDRAGWKAIDARGDRAWRCGPAPRQVHRGRPTCWPPRPPRRHRPSGSGCSPACAASHSRSRRVRRRRPAVAR